MTHGLAERRFQAVQLTGRLPRRAGFVTLIAHARTPLCATELTAVWQAIRRVLRVADPG